MTQAIGALMVLLGAMMFYIASSDLPHTTISEIWDDMLNIMKGNVGG